MPKTETVTVSYKGSVTPRKTSFLEAKPITMDFDATVELEGSDIANAAALQKAFQSAMKGQLDTQLAALDKWLAEKDKVLADAMKEFEQLRKDGFPANVQEANSRAALCRRLSQTLVKAGQLEDEFKGIVKDWAENAREQQGLVAMKMAVKTARVTTFSDKKWRVRAGQALKVTLVVAAIVLGAAAIVLTAGAATPIVLGIAVASAAVTGLASVAEVGMSLSKNLNIEKKLMANLTADVEKVREALDTAAQAKGSLGKHVTEMGNLIKLRDDDIQELEQALKKAEAPAKRLAGDLGTLNDELLPRAEIAKRRSAVEDMLDEVDGIKAKIAKLEEDNAQSRMVMADLETLVGDLSGLSTRTANTVGGNLKKKLTSVEGLLDVGKQVMGLGQAASKLGTVLAK